MSEQPDFAPLAETILNAMYDRWMGTTSDPADGGRSTMEVMAQVAARAATAAVAAKIDQHHVETYTMDGYETVCPTCRFHAWPCPTYAALHPQIIHREGADL